MDERRHTDDCLDASAADQSASREQAAAWITLLVSGKATAADAEALRRWRRSSAANREAFAEAKLLWDTLGPASKAVAARTAPSGELSARSTPAAARHLTRRVVLAGSIAASAAAIGYIGSSPALRLWPSIDELTADYRTGVGEQRRVAVSESISLTLNTRTSVSLRGDPSNAQSMELIAGEASVSAVGRMPFSVDAAGGSATGAARFDVRRDGMHVQVTCLDGAVDVACGGRSAMIERGKRVGYDISGLGQVAAVDLSAATAWQRGQLVFRHEPFAHVIAEVNRYRPGRIVVLNAELGRRDVVATFQLSQVDEVVRDLSEAFGARVRSLPGGLLLLS
ncbi:DUF4880 domain-containing protein [Microbacteriaceae bacterium K1510]|nr:DUF4880 domain-containing protein [Microbacteriaceae bacterium K1510]